MSMGTGDTGDNGQRGQAEPHFNAGDTDPGLSVAAGDRPAAQPPLDPRRARRRRLFGAVIAITALGGFGAVAWYATTQGQKNPGAVVPVSTAQNEPVKERPAEPGGMNVPNRGMEVFDQITPAKEPQKVERLLPPAEKPVDRPKAEAEPAPPAGPLVPKAPEIAARPEPAMPAANAAPKAPAATTAKPAAPKPAPAKTVAKAVAKPAPAAKPAAGSWQIQMGAVRSEARAKAAIARLVKANKDVLGSKQTSIVRADLGQRGVYFRLRAGPYASRAEANTACGKLAARKVGCMAVRP
jgi:cell division septation protein DedD